MSKDFMSEDIIKPAGLRSNPGRSALAAWLARLTPAQAVLLIIVASAVIRLIGTTQIGLESDSTYSAVIARQWSWSYFDHPPMHYLLIRLSTWLLGTDFGLGVRLPFMLLYAGSTWLLFRLTAIAFDEWAGFWAATAFNLCGIFTLAYSHFVVPDGPLFFFLLLAARILAPLLLAPSEPRRADLYWIGAGLAGGGALLSKYTAVISVAGLFVFLLTSKGQRHWLARRGPWIAAALTAVSFLPVIWWNSQHAWISFTYQGSRGVPISHGDIFLFLESIGIQAFFLIPWLYVPMLLAFLKALVLGPRRVNHWFFACLAAGPLLIFTTLTIFHRGLPHWTLPGWLFVFPLLGAEIVQLDAVWRARARRIAVGTAALLAFVCALLVAEGQTGAYARLAARWFPSAEPFVRDPMSAVYDWDQLGPILRERGLLDGDVKYIATYFWHNTARVGYVLGRQIPVLCVGTDTRHFRFINNPREFAGMNGLLIDFPDVIADDGPTIDKEFVRRERLPPIVLTRGGQPVIELAVERVYGLKPLP